MSYATVLLVSVVLGIDAFSVAVGIGLLGIKLKGIFLVSGVVSVFHVFMPLIGLYLGACLGSMVGSFARVIGALVLLTIGINMLCESHVAVNKPPLSTFNPQSFLSLILMASSVSLDALTVGFGLGTLHVDLLLTVLTMGVVAGLMTVAGLVLGQRLSKAIGAKAGFWGGLVLVIIGLDFLIR